MLDILYRLSFGFAHFILGEFYSTTKAIEEYIRNQLQEDKEYEQLTMKEVFDPFTGEPVTKDKK